MSDVSPYGVTQNADAALVTADALVGTHAGTVRENAVFGSAAGFSTAPYIPPPDPRLKRVGRCRAKNDTCMAYAMRDSDLCVFHAPGQARHDRIGDE